MSCNPIKALRVLLLAATATLLPFSMLFAGNLEPDAPPGPTMKTLDEVASSWSRVLPADERFELLLQNTVALDRETGLVWDRATGAAGGWWAFYLRNCYGLTRPWWGGEDGRKGWRPAAVHELATLVDTSQSAPALPAGHPFDTAIINERFWSATNAPDDPTQAFYVDFTDGEVGTAPKQTFLRHWCVRGP